MSVWLWVAVIALAYAVYRHRQAIDALRMAIARQQHALDALTPAPIDPRAPAREPEPAPKLRFAGERLPSPAPKAPAAALLVLVQAAADALPPQTAPAPRRTPARPLAERLSEHGLAWVGGVALALGGALLVGYMAQQGLFTPAARVSLGALLGVGLIVASEGVRRRRRDDPAERLIAALCAGAGAAVLYAAVWSAQVLYGFIALPVAAALLAGVAVLLFALSFRHGPPLAALAVVAGGVAPLATGTPQWSDPSLTGYVLAVAAAGAWVGWERRWPLVAALSAATPLLWAIASAQTHPERAAILLTAVPLAAFPRGRDRTGSTLASAALVAAALASLWLALSAPLPWLCPAVAVIALIGGLERRWARLRPEALAIALPASALAILIAVVRDPGAPAFWSVLHGAALIAASPHWSRVSRP